MFEHRSDPLATPAEFQRRMLQYGMITAAKVLFSRVLHRFHLEMEDEDS